jgi:hypothetical protein
MNTSTIIAVVAVVVVLMVAVLAVRPLLRRRRLQERFGPEYDRAVDSHGDRSAAEHELIEREKRYKEFDLRPLSTEARDRYAMRWADVQAEFVDVPEGAVADADRLLSEVMAERGYPTGAFEQQAADLSIEHSRTIERYHAAHDIHQLAGDGRASTEDLREAMVHYRALFVELLGGEDIGAETRARADADRVDTDRVDADRVDADRVDDDRVDADRVDADRVDADRVDADRVDADRVDADRVDADRVDADQPAARRVDGDRVPTDRADADRFDTDRDVRDGRYADRGDRAGDRDRAAGRDRTGRDGDADRDADLTDAERGRRGRSHTAR